MSDIRNADTLSSAYASIQESKFFVGYIGAMTGVSWMVFIRLILALVGIYSKRMRTGVASVEVFLFCGLFMELALVFRSALAARVPLTQAAKYRPFAGDLIIIGSGIAFIGAHYLTSLDILPFILNFIWISLLTARSTFHFRLAWKRATSAPELGSVPVILVGGKPVNAMTRV